jgi:FkbM family methyltransferase
LILAANVGATGTVIAIEPDPTNMSLLTRNLALNRASNVIYRQVAVLGYEGQATLYRSETNDGDHRVFDARDDDRFNNGVARTRVPVQTIVLDNYLARIGKPAGLVKMDIQGAEMLALPGMTQTLANPNVILFCEFWPYGLRQAGSDPMQFLKSLQELGLVLFEIVEAKQIVVPITIDELAHRFNDADYTNLICVHPSQIPHTSFLNV